MSWYSSTRMCLNWRWWRRAMELGEPSELRNAREREAFEVGKIERAKARLLLAVFLLKILAAVKQEARRDPEASTRVPACHCAHVNRSRDRQWPGFQFIANRIERGFGRLLFRIGLWIAGRSRSGFALGERGCKRVDSLCLKDRLPRFELPRDRLKLIDVLGKILRAANSLNRRRAPAAPMPARCR